MKRIIMISLVCSNFLYASSEVDELKQQLQEQNKVIQSLMKRLDNLENIKQIATQKTLSVESKPKQSPIQSYDYASVKTKNISNSASFSQKEYLPDIALIINSSAVGRNIDNEKYSSYEIPGFISDDPEKEIPFNPDRGFNLNYAEVAMSSAVDPNFDAFAVFHMTSDEFEIDEAYVSTRDLPNGLKIKAGKFKSAFGRYNEKHQHAWEFSEQALVYAAMFGPEGLSDAGIQVQWVAPTETYIMLGAEAMQGTNEQSFGYEKGNSLYNTYAKASIDITDDTSVLVGTSYIHGKNIEGNTDIYAADLTIQTQLSSYSSLAFQSEYIYRNMELNATTARQDGMYAQLVYKYNQNYAAGVRYDTLMKNNQGDNNLDMYTAMIEYQPFEFSRLRLEYSLDKSKYYDGKQKDVQQLMLELNVAVGAHGAHSY